MSEIEPDGLEAVFDVDFVTLPRTITRGPDFVGARLLMGVPGIGPETPKPLAVNNAEMTGVGYTRQQALADLRRQCVRFPSSLSGPQGTVANLRRGSVAAVDAALTRCKNDAPASAAQELVHGAVIATLKPRQGGT